METTSFNTRAYNKITRNGSIVTKESSTTRLKDEIFYYRNLPYDLGLYFPRVLDYQQIYSPYWIKLEYYDYKDIGKLDFNVLDSQKWEKIFNLYKDILNNFKRYSSDEENINYREARQKMFIDKTITEYQNLVQKFDYFKNLSLYPLITINNKKLKNFIEKPIVSTHIIYLKDFTEDGYTIDSFDNKLKKKNVSKDGYSQYHSEPFASIMVDEEIAWVLGLWFAEGSLSTFKGKPNGIRITLGSHEKNIAEKFYEIFSRRFNLFGNIYHSKLQRNGKIHSWISVNINSNIIGKYFASFGKGCKNKQLPNWVFSLSDKEKKAFLDGLIEGDGSFCNHDSVRITLANPILILQVYKLGLELGLEMSLQMQERASKLSSINHVYTIIFRNYTNNRNRARINSGVKFEDGLIYCPINKLLKTDSVCNVYDFTVDEDHSFSVSGVVVHNCFNSYVSDTMESILHKAAEVGMMSKLGGGTSAYFGDLRPRGAKISWGGESSGPVHFMEIYESIANVVSQGSSRRGSFAAYLPIEHPDIKEFLAIRSEGHPIQNMSIGVTITDKWMEDMIAGDESKRQIWAKVIKKRFETGYPYLFFTDTVNKTKPQVYKDKNINILCSNLCSEIALPSNQNESFVCDLAAMNLVTYDDWKDTDAIEVLTYFLDAVMEEFIIKTEGNFYMEAARNFAVRHRALGLGVLGWHSYLQSKMIPFESMDAKRLNVSIFKLIQEKTLKASKEMAVKYGEPELLKGYGLRNTTLTTLMPTTSSSFILGQVSQSIEPLNSNYFIKKLAKGNFTYKNPYLIQLLEQYGQNTDEIWQSILIKGGSVQHLTFLSDNEKEVFKTFGEISQKEIVIQAATRQKYLDQSQSLNLMIHPKTPLKDVNALIIEGFRLGIKTFYYQRSTNPAQELGRSILSCSSCQV